VDALGRSTLVTAGLLVGGEEVLEQSLPPLERRARPSELFGKKPAAPRIAP
jgi:hypothetical protein